MQRSPNTRWFRFHGAPCALLLISSAIAACGEDELLGVEASDGLRDGAAETASGGAAGSAPDSSATGGSGNTGGDAAAGSAGQAGSTGAGGSSGDGSSNGCGAPGSQYKLDVCLRLTRPADILRAFVPAYFGSIHNDCRVARMVDEHPNLGDFGNLLAAWSLEFWGCRENGVTTFGIADAVTELSAADAAVLIGRYIDLAALRLELSSAEEAEMRRALTCLSARAITDVSTTVHALSSCSDAGADGASDATSDSDGTGGTSTDGAGMDGNADAVPDGSEPDAPAD